MANHKIECSYVMLKENFLSWSDYNWSNSWLSVSLLEQLIAGESTGSHFVPASGSVLNWQHAFDWLSHSHLVLLGCEDFSEFFWLETGSVTYHLS